MTAPPIQCMWTGKAFEPMPRHHNLASAAYGPGEVVTLVPHEERSEVSHNHQFAWLQTAWENLPENLVAEYPSKEHLRKRALISTGWCTTQDYPCGTKAEAGRWAGFLRREVDEYTVVIPSESVVRVLRARSQGRGKMNPADFQASKTAILDWISALIGVDPEQLSGSQGAGGANNPARVAA